MRSPSRYPGDGRARSGRLAAIALIAAVGCGGGDRVPDSGRLPESEPPLLWPPPLSSHAMVYHDSLEAALVYGGSRPDRTMSDTLWSWDGERWRAAAAGGPPPRIHAALAYDRYRDRLVVYGGIGQDGATLADLWEWDGTRWEERRTGASAGTSGGEPHAGPGPRDHAAMIYSPSRGAVVLFGGQDAEDDFPEGTWMWDGERWESAPPPSPPPRATHRLAFDVRQGVILLFGGWGADEQLADLWRFDHNGWHRSAEMDPAGPRPSARGAHRYAFDEARGNLLLFGGLSGTTPMGDTWTWTRRPVGWRGHDVEGPAARNVHGMAYDRRRERVVLYGGIGADGRLSDLWEWDGRLWIEVARAGA